MYFQIKGIDYFERAFSQLDQLVTLFTQDEPHFLEFDQVKTESKSLDLLPQKSYKFIT